MKTKKRGFTIVELVIVIAIIAILAAVLIPVFTSMIHKAQVSDDTMLVKNLNTALELERPFLTDNDMEYDHPYEAVKACENYGYTVDRIESKSGYGIAWYRGTQGFVLIDLDEKQAIYPTVSGTEEIDVEKKEDFFLFRNTMPKEGEKEYGYSVYANRDGSIAGDIHLDGYGFDAGDTAGINNVEYVNTTGVAKNVVIRTNSDPKYTDENGETKDTTLTLNAPNDRVFWYGRIGISDPQAIDKNSLIVYGDAAVIKAYYGRIVLTESKQADKLIFESVEKEDENGNKYYTYNKGDVIIATLPGVVLPQTFDGLIDMRPDDVLTIATWQQVDENFEIKSTDFIKIKCEIEEVTTEEGATKIEQSFKYFVSDNDKDGNVSEVGETEKNEILRESTLSQENHEALVTLNDEVETERVQKNETLTEAKSTTYYRNNGYKKANNTIGKYESNEEKHQEIVEEAIQKKVEEQLFNSDIPADAAVYILETKVPYMSLQEALDVAEDNQTIVFLKDIDITNSSYQFQIKVDHTNIDLAKHTLTLHTTVNLAKKDGSNWVPVTVNMKNGTIINDDLITGLRYETGSAGTYEKVTFKAVNRDWSGSGSAGGHYSQSSAIQVYANNKTGSYEKNTYSFKNCIFAETTLELSGGSGSCNNYDVMVEGCMFTLTDTSSASAIDVNHYEYGSIVVKNSIFNINPVPGDGNAYGIYTQSDPSNTKNNYLHVYLSGNTFTCTNKAEPYEQRNSYYMSGSYSEATTFHDDGTNTYTMNNIPVSHYKTDSSNNLWREGTSSGSWDYRWTSSARYAVLEACEDEYKLFRTASGSGYKNGDMYLVQKDEGFFVASGTTINPIQYSWPTIDENNVVDYGGSYYDKSKVVYTTDLTSGLAGGNDDVKIYKLNGMTLLKFSDGKTTTDIGYVDSTEGYIYQCVYEDGKQYDTTVNGLTKNTHYTVDETGKITVNAGAFNQKRNATIYNRQKYTWTASGSATGSGTYYAGTATASFSVTTPQSASLYKVTSVQIGGVEVDPSKYYIKNDPKYSTFYVCFDNAATDITGNVTFTIAPISENLVAEVSAFRNDTTKYNSKLSYLFVEGEKVYIFNAGTSNMVFYTGSVTSPASTSAYTNTVTKTGDDVYFDYASSSTSKYNYKLGEKIVDQNGVQIYALNNVLKLVYSNVYYFGEDFTVTYGEVKEFTIPDFDANKHYELVGDNKSIATLDASTGKITIDTTLFSSSMYSKNTFSLGYRECYTITADGDVVGIGSKTTPSVTTTKNTNISSKNIYVTGDTNSYNITVTVGGVALASNQYTATWNLASKCYKLTINAQYVTGDIVVTATAK